jgi:hypothetical protein
VDSAIWVLTVRQGEIIKDPHYEEYRDMMTWLSVHFNPKIYDVEVANQKLSTM